MQSFNKQLVKEIRNQLQSSINMRAYDELPDLDIKVGNASYDEDEVTFKVIARIKGNRSKEEKDLDVWARLHDLDTNVTAMIDGKQFKLTGYKSKARKRPYQITEQGSGKTFVCDQQMVDHYFKHRRKEANAVG
tara:strand:- start:3096 stop:3497 length:402 start_codon:yes stop_codon:yes gene_type:complete